MQENGTTEAILEGHPDTIKITWSHDKKSGFAMSGVYFHHHAKVTALSFNEEFETAIAGIVTKIADRVAKLKAPETGDPAFSMKGKFGGQIVEPPPLTHIEPEEAELETGTQSIQTELHNTVVQLASETLPQIIDLSTNLLKMIKATNSGHTKHVRSQHRAIETLLSANDFPPELHSRVQEIMARIKDEMIDREQPKFLQ